MGVGVSSRAAVLRVALCVGGMLRAAGPSRCQARMALRYTPHRAVPKRRPMTPITIR